MRVFGGLAAVFLLGRGGTVLAQAPGGAAGGTPAGGGRKPVTVSAGQIARSIPAKTGV